MCNPKCKECGEVETNLISYKGRLLCLDCKIDETTIKDVPRKEIYVDQGLINTNIPGYQFLTFYTPYGIKRIESKLAQRIQAYGRGEPWTEYNWKGEVDWVYKNDTYGSLFDLIQQNKHIHKIIKGNLIFNLKQYREAHESINT